MRLKNYLNENEFDGVRYGPTPEEWIPKTCGFIKKKCQPFLKLLKTLPPTDMLYRGMSIGEPVGKKVVRQDRLPVAMFTRHADALNEILIKYKHVDRSKAMIATGDYGHTDQFGIPFYVFPIGSFNYTWFDSVDKDINFDFQFKKTVEEYVKRMDVIKAIDRTHINKVTGNPIDMSKEITQQKTWKQNAEDAISKYFVTNKDFKYAIAEGKEIWFDCKEYYFIRVEWIKHPQELRGQLF